MSIKLAFTSCCDAARDPEQRSWATLSAENPSHILLLGDNIYMDYGLGEHIGNGKAIHLPLAEFSQRMHAYYAQQWAVRHFRQALKGRQIHAIWDDHDLGCDNGRCLEPHTEEFTDSRYVPPAYRQCARVLFEQFRSALHTQPQHYPANPVPNGVVTRDLGSVAQTVELAAGVRLHLTDGRSYRPVAGSQASLLGETQREALQDALLPEPGINLIASGTTLNDWKMYYPDFVWLRQQAQVHRILVLSGDIHEPDFRERGRLYEATASAMAQPASITALVGKKSGVFALLTVDDAQLTLQWWVEGQPQAALTQHISRSDWQVA